LKLKVTVDEIVESTGESRTLVHHAVKAGHLRTFVVGRRRFAKPEDVQKWVDFLQAESDAGRPVSYQSRAADSERAASRAS
jgi:hypothetical protein